MTYKTLKRTGIAFAALALGTTTLSLIWLALFIDVDKSAQAIVPPRIVFLTRDGQPFAEVGPLMDRPVDLSQLSEHVAQAFYAIEDRRFRSHWGVDLRGTGRAALNNLTGGSRQGGSTLTQQLAKNVYLLDPKTGQPRSGMFRKVQEALIAGWLELWLTKDQILERYLSNVAFGANVYGLRAASLRYFYRQPERLTLRQAIMLAGLVQAPSRYDPGRNLDRAQARAALVAAAMAKAGYIGAEEVASLGPATLDMRDLRSVDLSNTGTYFGDWAREKARASVAGDYTEQRVTTTLDGQLQGFARAAVASVPAGDAHVALVAMRPNGEVVAMIGDTSYRNRRLNLAVYGKRQPGSTFKLFTYLAALRDGMTPSSMVSDARIETGPYRPRNSHDEYGGSIPLTHAFARSSNVAAVRLFQRLGPDKVIEVAP